MKNPIGLTPVQAAEDILQFEGQVDPLRHRKIIQDLLDYVQALSVQLAMSNGQKAVAELEDELRLVKEDRDNWKQTCGDLLGSIARVGREVCE
jgi:FtsZ-binding cell division protein ZapB